MPHQPSGVFPSIKRISLLLLVASGIVRCSGSSEPTGWKEQKDAFVIIREHYVVHIAKQGFRYALRRPGGEVIADAHPVSGIQLAPSDETLANVIHTKWQSQQDSTFIFEVTTEDSTKATVRLEARRHAIKLSIQPQEEGQYTIVGRTHGLAPAYGLGEQGAFLEDDPQRGTRPRVELTGVTIDSLRASYWRRMISNFVVFPQQGLAEVNIEPGAKLVRLTQEENAQGSQGVAELPALYYLLGSPQRIYRTYRQVREAEGYAVYKPKSAWFGVGWEAYGALAWNTNEQTVTDNVNRYLDDGYPLDWMVVGSGYWPSASGEYDDLGSPVSESATEKDRQLQATTSFGLWDTHRYPDPPRMIDYFHQRGLLFIIGLRIGFIPGGPFTDAGLQQDYFLKDTLGDAKLWEVGFPRVPVYLLDSRNERAVEWYVDLCQKWLDYGVDGFKEDLYDHSPSLPDDLIDPVNRALMDRGVYVMGRNNYVGSPVDLHRYDDFNYHHPQDRGPINGLAFAYSGFPYVYPDIVGGTGQANDRFGGEPKDKMRLYMMRYAQYAAVNPSMSFGYGPWNFDEETSRVCREAAQLHRRLKPYIYSEAVRTYHTGFPYTLTPLPLAYPDDENVYGLADTTRRSYEWLIGESLLATPLYGDDYATAQTRDIYLPAGTWIDYDSGEKYDGPSTLSNFPLPIGKTPLFVGGSGIVIEEEQGALKGRIYPVTQQANMTFYHLDGETESRISLDNPDWNAVTVTDQTTETSVEVLKERHAHTFTLEPGHDYLIH